MVAKSTKLIPVRDAARKAGRTAETVRRWIWEGKLPAKKLGNQLFVREADLAGMIYRVQGPESERMALLDDIRAIRSRIARRAGSHLDVIAALDRSREAHP